MIAAIVVSLLIGAVATSTVEYLKNYNLVDFLKDKIVGLYQKLFGKAAATVEVAKQEVDLTIGRFKKNLEKI